MGISRRVMEPDLECTPAPRRRQLRLFTVENPLGTRLGAAFFRGLPAKPGVYFFHDVSDRLLYIGQSNDLRARVGSYRHVTPERHPRRTLRLVHRIARIVWQECGTHADAIELERALLLERRPPFNRAGVWPGYAWWLTVSASDDHVDLRLSRQPSEDPRCIGPLPSGYRHAYGSLLRCTFRMLHPGRPLSAFPLGLLNHIVPLHLRFGTRDSERIASSFTAFATGSGSGFVAELQAVLEGAAPLELEYWTAELDALQKFAAKPRPLPSTLLPAPLMVSLPLFPGL